MKQAHYNYGTPCCRGRKEEALQIISRIIPQRLKKAGLNLLGIDTAGQRS